MPTTEAGVTYLTAEDRDIIDIAKASVLTAIEDVIVAWSQVDAFPPEELHIAYKVQFGTPIRVRDLRRKLDWAMQGLSEAWSGV
jgi:hypothetical protein